MSMNPLDNYPKARTVAYFLQWVINGVLGITSIVLVSLDMNPTWWIITQAVFNFLWTYLGLTAQKNVTQPEPDYSADWVYEDNEPNDYTH